MKLITVQSARVTWLFDLTLINPLGLSYKPLLDSLRERYRFAKAPVSMLDRDEKKGLTFDQGQFQTADGRDIFVQLRVFNDGIVAVTSSSTKDATEFLEDLAVFIQSEGFKFPTPHQITGKGYVSVVHVEMKTDPLSALNPHLEKISRSVESRTTTLDGKHRTYQTSVLHLLTEDVGKPMAPVAFKLERKLGLPFDSKNFYSEAALETEDHLAILEEIEAAFS